MDVWRREDPLLRGDAAGCADHILSRTNRLAVLGVAVAGVVGRRIAGLELRLGASVVRDLPV